MEKSPSSLQYASVCSGIEAVSVAWRPLGMTPAWFAEIAAFPSAVLAHHYPGIPNLGDMTTLKDQILTGEVAAPGIMVGGTPCQTFSVAGLRAGLADHRGVLTLKYVELANAFDLVRLQQSIPATIAVWENVPGVLSDRTNAFGCFLGALAGERRALQPPGKRWSDAGVVFGPQRNIAWRVLDAQYFGLAQRRRRVFVVASARANFDPAKVLFEPQSLYRHPPSRSTQGPEIAGAAGTCVNGSCIFEVNNDQALAMYCIAHGQAGAEIDMAITPTLTCNHEAPIVVCITGDVTHALTAEGHDASEDGTGRGYPIVVCSCCNNVRRLMPKECERLQGFPEDYTRIPIRHYLSKRLSALRPIDRWEQTAGGWMLMAADAPRYAAIGNSMAVPCLRWLGQRLISEVASSG